MTAPAYQDCGTYAAYQRHKREGVAVDDACRTANNAYQQTLRSSSPALRDREYRTNNARRRAGNRLIAAHLAEFRELLAEELQKDGDRSRVKS
jgi:hypothetical protein